MHLLNLDDPKLQISIDIVYKNYDYLNFCVAMRNHGIKVQVIEAQEIALK